MISITEELHTFTFLFCHYIAFLKPQKIRKWRNTRPFRHDFRCFFLHYFMITIFFNPQSACMCLNMLCTKYNVFFFKKEHLKDPENQPLSRGEAEVRRKSAENRRISDVCG